MTVKPGRTSYFFSRDQEAFEPGRCYCADLAFCHRPGSCHRLGSDWDYHLHSIPSLSHNISRVCPDFPRVSFRHSNIVPEPDHPGPPQLAKLDFPPTLPGHLLFHPLQFQMELVPVAVSGDADHLAVPAPEAPKGQMS